MWASAAATFGTAEVPGRSGRRRAVAATGHAAACQTSLGDIGDGLKMMQVKDQPEAPSILLFNPFPTSLSPPHRQHHKITAP
eukprot:g44896.t1